MSPETSVAIQNIEFYSRNLVGQVNAFLASLGLKIGSEIITEDGDIGNLSHWKMTDRGTVLISVRYRDGEVLTYPCHLFVGLLASRAAYDRGGSLFVRSDVLRNIERTFSDVGVLRILSESISECWGFQYKDTDYRYRPCQDVPEHQLEAIIRFCEQHAD